MINGQLHLKAIQEYGKRPTVRALYKSTRRSQATRDRSHSPRNVGIGRSANHPESSQRNITPVVGSSNMGGVYIEGSEGDGGSSIQVPGTPRMGSAKRTPTPFAAKMHEDPNQNNAADVSPPGNLNLDSYAKDIGHERIRKLREEVKQAYHALCQWLQKEVVEKTAVQVKHVTLLAPRHFLMTFYSNVARDEVMPGSPYYLRRRMVYTTPWQPNFDTKRVMAKKMTCWLDIVEVDPLLEEEGRHLLSALGQVIQLASMTEQNESKFSTQRVHS
ncbi:hypothetical protein R1sor_013892 [Riccia sorocarpa]|uniref:DUF4283 domain-containing protein n=1 Tax=Riccia sorocarpa TaxID=122646 RepID=A0ABD3H810_9MARC